MAHGAIARHPMDLGSTLSIGPTLNTYSRVSFTFSVTTGQPRGSGSRYLSESLCGAVARMQAAKAHASSDVHSNSSILRGVAGSGGWPFAPVPLVECFAIVVTTSLFVIPSFMMHDPNRNCNRSGGLYRVIGPRGLEAVKPGKCALLTPSDAPFASTRCALRTTGPTSNHGPAQPPKTAAQTVGR